MTFNNISRYRAAAIHLAISAGIATLVLSLMLFLWYPHPLFRAMGGVELATLIIGVDVVIGPLITLIIFDTRKKELVFDLAAIAVLQLAALGYGTYAMHSGRPVFIVFADERFVVAAANDMDPAELAKGRSDEFRELSLTGPRLVATEPPTDPNERSNLAFAAFAGGGIHVMPRYYVPYPEQRPQVLAAARPLAELGPDGEDTARLKRYLEKSARPVAELRCLPVTARRGVLTAVIDAGSGDLVEIIDIKPTLKIQ